MIFKEYDLPKQQKVTKNYKLSQRYFEHKSTFKPYNKPDDQIQYMHTESNHPPNFMKYMFASIENGL